MSTNKSSTTKSPGRPPGKRATKNRSVDRPKKVPPVSVRKTLVTIHPDGIITVEKAEETVTEQTPITTAAT